MATFTIVQAAPNREKLLLYPNEDLSGCTDWTAHGDTQNYKCVDELKDVPDYSNTYVSTATDTYAIDQYELPNFSNLGTIKYVKVITLAKSEYPPSNLMEYYIAISPSSTCSELYLSPKQNLTTGWAKKTYLWKQNPSTISSWSWADINNLTIGMKAKSPEVPVDAYAYLYLRPTSNPIHGLAPWGAANNFQCVDEVVADYWTTYVFANILGIGGDRYGMQNHTIENRFIRSVTVCAVSRCADNSKVIKVETGLYLNGSTRSKWSNLTTTWTTYEYEFLQNPFTVQDWNWNDIDNLQGLTGINCDSNTLGQVTQFYFKIKHLIYEYKIPTISVTQCYAEIGYSPDTSTCTLNKPTKISTNHARNIKMLNFWNGEREVYDLNRSGKSMVLVGSENGTSACSTIICMRDMARNGAIVTVSELTPTYFNSDYRIRSFGWDKISSKPEYYKWILYLEEAN